MVQPSKWSVQVRFHEQGVLRAEAGGSLNVMPEDALRIITHPAGDELFRVVNRRTISAPAAPTAVGGNTEDAPAEEESVEVENRAPVRVIAYKFWAISRVLFTVRLAKPPAFIGSKGSVGIKSRSCHQSVAAPIPGRAGSSVTFSLISSVSFSVWWGSGGGGKVGRMECTPDRTANTWLITSSNPSLFCYIPNYPDQTLQNMLKQLTGAWQLEPLLAPGSSSEVAGTRLAYCHDVRPKGLPPGVQFVPGMSGAVRNSISKEVWQMVDKVNYVADKVGRVGVGLW